TISVACGFHAGDPMTMMRTIDRAKEHGLAVGAHPGLPDLLGFGRRLIHVTPEETYAYFVYQIGALQGVLASKGVKLQHVKPHGAFGELLKYEERAEAAIEAIRDVMDDPMVYYPAEAEGDV